MRHARMRLPQSNCARPALPAKAIDVAISPPQKNLGGHSCSMNSGAVLFLALHFITLPQS